MSDKLKNPVWTVQPEERLGATNCDQKAFIGAFWGYCYGDVRLALETAKDTHHIIGYKTGSNRRRVASALDFCLNKAFIHYGTITINPVFGE